MSDGIIKVFEYILNNEIVKTIGIVYFVYAAIITCFAVVVLIITIKGILITRNKIKKRK